MRNKKIKSEIVLFISRNFSPFIRRDYEILDDRYELKRFLYLPSKKFTTNLIYQIHLLFWTIKNIFRAEILYIWFADYHSLLPILFSKLFHKKSFLVLGGYDVANIPGFDYGSFQKPIRAFFARNSLKLASMCLPVSNYVQNIANQKVKNINAKLVYNGVDVKLCQKPLKKENVFLTVAKCDTFKRFKIKGIDTFIKIAPYFPDYKFYVIGVSENIRKELHNIPDNVYLKPPLYLDELNAYHKKAKYYCQFSIVESFGLTVLESICFGAIPIISNNGALPEIYDGLGIKMEIGDIEKIVKKIKKNINIPPPPKEKIEKLRKKYSIKNRAKKIYKLLDI